MSATGSRPAAAGSPGHGLQRTGRSARTSARANEVVTKRSGVWRIDGTSIPVWTSGSGPALLIVHGEATNHQSWDRVRCCLPDYTVLIMDRRATFEYPFAPLDMEQEIRDVAAVANTVDDDIAILGHSSGALCALGAAPMIPRLRHLILYEPPLERGEHVGPAVDRLHHQLRIGDLEGLVDTWLLDYLRLPASVAERIKQSEAGDEIRRYASFLPREAAEHLHWRLRPDCRPDQDVRMTYLVGGNTPQGSREYRGMIDELAGLVPDFEVRELAGERHFAHFSNPELLAASLQDILAST